MDLHVLFDETALADIGLTPNSTEAEIETAAAAQFAALKAEHGDRLGRDAEDVHAYLTVWVLRERQFAEASVRLHHFQKINATLGRYRVAGGWLYEKHVFGDGEDGQPAVALCFVADPEHVQ